MNLGYICEDCGLEVTDNEYEEQSDILCAECGGKLSKNVVSNETVFDNTNDNSFLIYCESCSHQFSKRATSCPKCGWKPKETCHVCKQQIPYDNKSCPDCGDPEPFKDHKAVEYHKLTWKIILRRVGILYILSVIGYLAKYTLQQDGFPFTNIWQFLGLVSLPAVYILLLAIPTLIYLAFKRFQIVKIKRFINGVMWLYGIFIFVNIVFGPSL